MNPENSAKLAQKSNEIENHYKSRDFRWKAAALIANNVIPLRASATIQCNLLSGRRGDRSVNKNICQFCKCVLPENCCPRLIPRKVHRRKVRKLVRQGQSAEKVYFTKFELSLFKKCTAKPANTLAITCSICRKTMKYPLKPWHRSKPQPELPYDLPVVEELPKKKKKKKKDPLAGLKLGTVPLSGKKKAKKVALSMTDQMSSEVLTEIAEPKEVILTTTNPEDLDDIAPSKIASTHWKDTKGSKTENGVPMLVAEGTKSIKKLSTKKAKNGQKLDKNAVGAKQIEPAKKIVSFPKLKVKPIIKKSKGPPEFLKKLKKGSKLANLIAKEEASKLDTKKNPKSNIFALLHGWVGK